MSRTARGYLIAMVGVIIWSTAGVFIGYLITTYRMPALVLALWRNLLVCVALLPALVIVDRSLLRIEAGQLRFFVFYGFILAVFNSIWALSVQFNGAAVATVLAYSSAGFTAILAYGLFKEKLGPAKIAAIILSLAGCVLVSNAYSPTMWTLNPLGIATGLGSGILFAAYTLMGKETARRSLSPWTAMLYAFGFGSVFVLLFNLIPGLPGAADSTPALWPRLPLDGWLILAFLSAGPTLLGFGLYNTSMRYLPASIVNLLATTEPALTAVEAYLFLNERLAPVQIVGGLIILSAVAIVQLERD
ncbi:MAG: EamA family transporter [Anaerolineales bacterium]|nr:EamA family transporter [Anaerolineales bacterium]